MARVLTFSRVYPSYHPKAGQPTYFVEKILQQQNINILGVDAWQHFEQLNPYLPADIINRFIKSLVIGHEIEKGHTIRAGHRWKVGDWFSPRVWAGKPYRSKQIQFAPDMQVKKVWEVEIIRYKQLDHDIHIRTSADAPWSPYWDQLALIARNDGLSPEDFAAWFNTRDVFQGQIICWNENICY